MLLKQKFYELMHKGFVRILGWFDFRCYNVHLYWFHDREYLKAWKSFPKSNNVIHDRRFNLYNLAKSVRNIPGDLAECGVYKGASSHLIMKANQGANKYLHIFDSFEGLSVPDKEDTPIKDRTFRWEKNDLSVSEDLVRKNLKQFSKVHYYQGWIPDRFSDVQDKKFSFVHIDVDLYQPTLDSLEFFYNRMNRGGLIVCDDYGYETCPGARKSMDEFVQGKPEIIIHLTTGQGVIVKQ